jgi:hypothetical protein
LVLDIKLEQFRLVPLYSIFFNSKKEDRITPRGRRHIAKPRSYLCTCVIGVCSRVFSVQTYLSHKGLVGLVANLLSISQQLVSELGCRSLLAKKKCSP